MRLFLVAAVLPFAFDSTLALAQESAKSDSNISCIERIQMPSYPALAQSARIQGTITASVSVRPNASEREIKMDREGNSSAVTRGLAIIVPLVEAAIRTATFRTDCDGKNVTLVFRFELRGPAVEPPKTSVEFGSPNQFWIVASAPTAAPTIN